LKVLKNSDPRMRDFFEKISRSEEVNSTTIVTLIKELELNSPRTARLIKILLHLPKTRFRKELANTVLNIMDMPAQGGKTNIQDQQSGGQGREQGEEQGGEQGGEQGEGLSLGTSPQPPA